MGLVSPIATISRSRTGGRCIRSVLTWLAIVILVAPAAAQPVCLQAGTGPAASEYYGDKLQAALVFGVDSYMGKDSKLLKDLETAASDAEEIAGRLHKLGFGVRCVLNATADLALREIDAAKRKLEALNDHLDKNVGDQGAARFVFYFAGHGATEKRDRPSTVMFFAGRKNTGFNCSSAVGDICFDPVRASIPLSTIIDALTKFAHVEPVLLFDGCRANLDLGPDFGNGASEAELSSLPSRRFFLGFSTQAGKVASDGGKRFMPVFKDHVGPPSDGSFGKTFAMIFDTAKTSVPLPQAPHGIANDLAALDVWHIHRLNDGICANIARGLWTNVTAAKCPWNGNGCVSSQVWCAKWNLDKFALKNASSACWNRIELLLGRYHSSCSEDALVATVALSVPQASGFTRLAAERVAGIAPSSIAGARRAIAEWTISAAPTPTPPATTRGTGTRFTPSAINALVRGLDAKTVNDMVRSLDTDSIATLTRKHGKSDAAEIVAALEPETVSGLVSKLDRATMNEFVRKHDFAALAAVAEREVDGSLLGIVVDKLDTPTIHHLTSQLDPASMRSLMRHMEQRYLDKLIVASRDAAYTPGIEGVFRHSPGGVSARGSGAVGAEPPPLVAPDLVRAEQPTVLRRLPWTDAPPLEAAGTIVRLEPGRTYERDCEALQCTLGWTGVRVRMTTGRRERGYAPVAALTAVPPTVVEAVSYVGGSIVPDHASVERVRRAFAGVNASPSAHLRITTRIDAAGTPEARALAGARAAVLADMAQQAGIPVDRIRWHDHVTSPDPTFPRAVVEIHPAASG